MSYDSLCTSEKLIYGLKIQSKYIYDEAEMAQNSMPLLTVQISPPNGISIYSCFKSVSLLWQTDRCYTFVVFHRWRKTEKGEVVVYGSWIIICWVFEKFCYANFLKLMNKQY